MEDKQRKQNDRAENYEQLKDIGYDRCRELFELEMEARHIPGFSTSMCLGDATVDAH